MSDATPPAERAHSELGASVAARFFACPGSVLLSRGMPNRSSIHAELGTAAHALGELCLRGGQDTIEYIDRVVEGHVVDETMADNVQVYIDVCREHLADAEAFGIEQRFDLARFNPPVPMFGTSDFWCRYPSPDGSAVLRIVDYKNGWLQVAAQNNPQLKYYALGAMILDPAPVHKIEAIIVQRDTVKRTEFDPVELIEWSIDLIAKAHETQRPDASLAAGPWCRFCPARGQCAEQTRHALAVAQMEFAVPVDSTPDSPRTAVGEPPDSRTLDPREIGAALARTADLEMWIKALRETATAAISRGVAVPGYKLVPTRPQAGWRDPEAAVSLLSDVFEIDPHTRDILTPPQARARITTERYTAAKQAGTKTSKKAIEIEVRRELDNLVAYRSSGLTLVSDSDTREATPTAGSEFGPVDLET